MLISDARSSVGSLEYFDVLDTPRLKLMSTLSLNLLQGSKMMAGTFYRDVGVSSAHLLGESDPIRMTIVLYMSWQVEFTHFSLLVYMMDDFPPFSERNTLETPNSAEFHH